MVNWWQTNIGGDKNHCGVTHTVSFCGILQWLFCRTKREWRVCVVCQWWKLAVRPVSALWCLKPLGLGGSELGDRVVFWFGFGQGVNKSGEEALVTYRPADNISGSGDLSAKPNSSCDTHTHTLTHICTQYLQKCYTFTIIALIIIVTLFVCLLFIKLS